VSRAVSTFRGDPSGCVLAELVATDDGREVLDAKRLVPAPRVVRTFDPETVRIGQGATWCGSAP